MDLSKLSKLSTGSPIIDGIIVIAVIALVGYTWRKRKSLPCKIKSLITKVGSWDFIQRVFQTHKGIDHPSLEEYKQPFHDRNQWTRRFDPSITLSIPLSDETRPYYGVNKIEIRRSYPFNNLYELIITHSNENKINKLEGPHCKILKLIKQCYFREISENR